MYTAILWVYSVIAVLLGSVISLELEYQNFSIDVCDLKHSIAEKCNSSRIGQHCTGKYVLGCSSKLAKDEDDILSLNKDGTLYYCSFKFSQEGNFSPKNITLYKWKTSTVAGFTL